MHPLKNNQDEENNNTYMNTIPKPVSVFIYFLIPSCFSQPYLCVSCSYLKYTCQTVWGDPARPGPARSTYKNWPGLIRPSQPTGCRILDLGPVYFLFWARLTWSRISPVNPARNKPGPGPPVDQPKIGPVIFF